MISFKLYTQNENLQHIYKKCPRTRFAWFTQGLDLQYTEKLYQHSSLPILEFKLRWRSELPFLSVNLWNSQDSVSRSLIWYVCLFKMFEKYQYCQFSSSVIKGKYEEGRAKRMEGSGRERGKGKEGMSKEEGAIKSCIDMKRTED